MRGMMRLAMMGVPGAQGGGGVNALDAYFDTYVPVLRYRLEETEGTTIANTGSAGAVLNGTASGTFTLGSDSGTNAGKGIECDGATTLIVVPHNAAISGFEAITVLAVARSDSAGENLQGIFATKTNEWTLRQGSSGRIVFERNYTGEGAVNAQAITALNALTYEALLTVAARIGADGVPHIFLNGEEVTYSSRTTGVGTPRATTETLNICSIGGAYVFDGGLFDLAVVEGELSDELILAHYEASFFNIPLSAPTYRVAFSGTSITEAAQTGYRPLTEAALRETYNTVHWRYTQSAYSGSSTWVRLWYMAADLFAEALNTIVYEAVSANYEGAYSDQAKAIEEGAIRRLRANQPNARILIIGMPEFEDNQTPGPTNVNQLAFLQALCTQYGMTYVDWPGRLQDLLDAETYALPDLYFDIVHPSWVGHAEISTLLLETLTQAYVEGADSWTGDLEDYPAQYDDGTFENTANYIARNGTDNDGTTGTWTADGTTLVSSEAGAIVTWTGTFETFGVDIDATDGFTMEHNFDSSGWTQDGYLAGVRNIHQLAPNFSERGIHTVQIRVVSGTVKINRFLAI